MPVKDVRLYSASKPIDIPDGEKYDMAFVDGPAAVHVKKGPARFNTSLAASQMSDIVVMHDSKRPGEQETAKQLFSNWIRYECPVSNRGLTVFMKRRSFGAFATVVRGEGYYKLLLAMLRSLNSHVMKDTPRPLVVITDFLSDDQKDKIRNLYLGDVVFWTVDTKKYGDLGKGQPKFWALESFNLPFNKVVFLDADLLILKPIGELFEMEVPIVAMAHEHRRNVFNSGVMIFSENALNSETYEQALNFPWTKKKFGKDQQIYNEMFQGRITELPQKWNTLVSEVPRKGEKLDTSEVYILHYIYKPDHVAGPCDEQLRKLWRKFSHE